MIQRGSDRIVHWFIVSCILLGALTCTLGQYLTGGPQFLVCVHENFVEFYTANIFDAKLAYLFLCSKEKLSITHDFSCV